MAKPDFQRFSIPDYENFTQEDYSRMLGFEPVSRVRAPTVKDLGSGFYDIEGQGVKYFDPSKAGEGSGGFSGVDRNNILSLISSGGDVDSGLLNSVYGTDDGYHHWRFAHVRSPAHQAMLDNLDGNYGTKGIRMFSNALAQQLGVDPEVFDRVAGQKFADLLKEGKYSVSDQVGMNQIADSVFAKAQELTGRELPQNLRQQVYDYNGQVRGLWDVPHPKRSGFAKQVAGDIAGGALSLGGALLKPIGLEDYAAPIIGAGITYVTGGAGAGILGTAGSAALGGATAAALPAVANQDFSGALKGAALGGAAGAIGGFAAGYNPVTNLGVAGNTIANQAVQGGLSGAAGGLLTGEDPIKAGLLGAAVSGGATALSTGIQAGANAISDAIGNPVPKQVTADLSRNPVGLLGDDVRVQEPGISPRFNPNNPNAINALDPDFSLGVKPNTTSATTLPYLGGMGDGVGLVSTVRGVDNQPVAFQGVNGIARPGFTTAIGNINSFVNDPNLQGRDVVQAGQVRNFGVNAPVTTKGSDEAAQRLLGLLAGGGALAAGAGLLSGGGNEFAGGGVPSRPLQKFQLSPTVNRYEGDFASYGERGSGGFRFYNAPVTGLLG